MHISRKVLGLIVCMAAGVGAFAQTQAPKVTWIWDDKLDAVVAAPKIHKVLFENDRVRLLEVTIHAGEKEPMHGHRYPSVFAYDAPQPRLENEVLGGGMTLQPASDVDGELPRCRTMGVQAPHSVKITDTFEQHFYRMEFKKVDGKDILTQR